MNVEIKYLHSPDIPNLEEYKPEISDNFSYLLQMFIGEVGKDGEESFDLIVCTPKWLLSNYSKSEIIFGIHHIIVFEYNYQKIYGKLKSFIDNIDFTGWEDVGLKIGTIGKWEFQDYKIQKELKE